ncbi:MAG: hypothetical protein ABI345_05860 [Jatrophihabitans sp.]
MIRTVRGGRIPGEIRVLDFGEPVLLLAFCDVALEIGRRVKVTSSRGSRQVDVQPWP